MLVAEKDIFNPTTTPIQILYILLLQSLIHLCTLPKILYLVQVPYPETQLSLSTPSWTTLNFQAPLWPPLPNPNLQAQQHHIEHLYPARSYTPRAWLGESNWSSPHIVSQPPELLINSTLGLRCIFFMPTTSVSTWPLFHKSCIQHLGTTGPAHLMFFPNPLCP